MSRRWLRSGAVVALMVMFGAGVYFGLGFMRHTAGGTGGPKKPEETHPQFTLPGTIVVAQSGTLYKLVGDKFTAIAKGQWTQPYVTPDHQHIIAVRREYNYSDLYELDMQGNVVRQLTDNASGDVPSDHWSFYPRLGPDGNELFYDYDPKYQPNLYTVNLSVYTMSLAGGQAAGTHRWSYPASYGGGVPIGTGGDLQPVPLPSGGYIAARYQKNDAYQMYGQLWVQDQPAANEYVDEPGHALTGDTTSCYAPALSPDGHELAMVCNDVGKENVRLLVAPFDGTSLGPAVTVYQGLCNSPTWAPDGGGLLFLAPAEGATGYFQLDYVSLHAPTPTPASRERRKSTAVAATPTIDPAPARRMTTENNFDATSPPAWFQ
jgi:hypothetical protein